MLVDLSSNRREVICVNDVNHVLEEAT